MTQTDDLPYFNADEWAKMFGTSTYCIPMQDDAEEFDLTHTVPSKRELDKPMYDGFIQQDIALSNPLTQPHQTYLEVTQREKIKVEETRPGSHEEIYAQENN